MTKAAVRVIKTDPSKEFLAVGGGYLYDNEIHLYRWNEKTRNYDKVWDSGDQIIQGDVLSLAFGDTDNNDFMEIAAGSADGHVYVFEQEHIYDPFDNMENQFVHVWTSPKIQQVWGVEIADIDKDYLPDVIAGAWDGNIHVYEYFNHSGYPFSKQHWIEYAEKVTIPVGERIFSLSVGDTNGNRLPEIVAGTQNGRVYIHENNGTVLTINGKPWPLTQDNSYRYHWDTGNLSWKPIIRVTVDNLDDDTPDEVVYVAAGQGTYVINFDPSIGSQGTYLTKQLWEPLDSWELGGLEGAGHFLNHWIDWMTWSNNNDTGEITSLITTMSDVNATVYFRPPWFANNTIYLEPYEYPDQPGLPKNTVMALDKKLQPLDGNYTVFNASVRPLASAIVDWGKDGEIMGDGLFAIPSEGLGYDVQMWFADDTPPDLSKISFEISREGEEWELIQAFDISTALINVGNGIDEPLLLDIDPALSKRHWAYARYMRINVTNTVFKIDSAYAPVLYRPMDTATSLTIGSLDLDYFRAYTTGVSEGKKIVLGTSDGKIVMFRYNPTTKNYDLLWNSYKNDSYTQGTNIWDIVEVKSPGKIPTWLFNETKSPIIEQVVGWKFIQLASILPPPSGSYGEVSSLTHVSLFKSFFDAILNGIPEFSPLKDIIELHIPENDLIIGTTTGQLAVFPALTHNVSTLGGAFFADVNNNPFYWDKMVSPTFVDLNQDADYFPEALILSWASNNPNLLYDPTRDNIAVAGIDVFTFDTTTPPLGVYKGPKFDLAQVEITGLLKRALEKSQRMPQLTSGDIDGDGDLDLVLTNGRVYLIENIENALFQLNTHYFRDIIDSATNKLFDSPFLYDFDEDGDMDLSVGWSNRKGTINATTYYQNVGSGRNPKWRENKWLYTNSWGGLRFNNLTKAAPALDGTSGRITHLTTYNWHTDSIVQLDAEYDNHNAFVVGTNPLIARLEINLKSGTDSHGNTLANYGYHVFEVWNSEAELKRWTLTLKTGDMDQDGRKEVIVGDYDNNLYVFEHLTNNTYKRAFRSQDITHEELSTSSPYAWQELEGVSGTFYRTIWDHVEELVVGLDMDNDGFLEMVATAGLSIFVWEQNNDGFVSIDDEYVLIWQADMRHSVWANLFKDLGVTQFTAAAFGGDIDLNGYGEFILGAGPFLFVFESNGANQFYENFLIDPYPVRGRYFVPGNPLASPSVRTLSIESIVVADTDGDLLNEIIVGGTNTTWWGQTNGFVAILENQIGTYDYTWWAPLLWMEDNPVFDVTVDNQDYDNYSEIIAGTFKGVVIYENAELDGTRDNTYINRTLLTSFVNFPTIKLKQMFDLEAKIPLALRNTDFIELQFNHSIIFAKGHWLQIFKAGLYLYFATSDDYGENWKQWGRVTTSKLVVDSVGGGPFPYAASAYEFHPSLFQTSDGRIWLAFTGHLSFTGFFGNPEGIWLLELKADAANLWWENGVAQQAGYTLAIDGSSLPGTNWLYNPSVWSFSNNTMQRVAISYLNSTDGGIYWQGDYLNPTAAPMGQLPSIGTNATANRYQAVSHDAVRSVSGDVVLVFTGRLYIEAKVDLDIWVARSNSTPVWDATFGYSRATVDAIDELHPSITQTVTQDHALMVIYEADGGNPSGALHVTYSKDDGDTWREPEPVTTTPPFATYLSFPAFGFSVMVLKSNPFVLVRSLISIGPAITAHWEGGFAYSFMAQYSFFTFQSVTVAGTAASVQTLNQGYSQSIHMASLGAGLSLGDISAHSGLVKAVGGGLTTGGGSLSYQGVNIGLLQNVSLQGGGGSALIYSPSTMTGSNNINYQTVVTGGTNQYTAYGGSLIAFGDDATGSDNPSSDPNQGSGYTPGMTVSSAPDSYGSGRFNTDKRNPDRGYFNNIFFGMNPSSNFTLFDFTSVTALDTGDSDNDFRREIAIASGNKAYLVEVSRTGGSNDPRKQALQYYQGWQSDSFPNPTTDIELFDANRNGIDEVIISSEQGNVYAFEGMVVNAPRTNLLFVDWDVLWENIALTGDISSLDPVPDELIASTDFGRDGFDDIIVAASDPAGTGYGGYPIIRTLNGTNGAILWTYNLSSYVSKNSWILSLESLDMDGDEVKDAIFLIYDDTQGDSSLFVLNGATGTEIRADMILSGFDQNNYTGLYLVDLDSNNVSDILVPNQHQVFLANPSTGATSIWSNVSFPDSSWKAEHIASGNNTLAIVARKMQSGLITQNGTVAIFSYDGTPLYQFNTTHSRFGLTSTILDVNQDNTSDILILEEGTLTVYNGNNFSVALGNYTFSEAIGNYKDAILYDFNQDTYMDVMFQIRTNGGNHTETFESIPLGRIRNNSLGLIFSETSPSIITDGWNTYSAAGFRVAHSGNIVAYSGEANNSIIIKEKARKVSAWFSTGIGYGFNFTLLAYDEDGKLLTLTTFPSNTPNTYVELNDPKGRIYKVRVSGTPGQPGWESWYCMDDFSFIGSGPTTKLVTISGLAINDVLWEYFMHDTHANEIKQADIDRDGEPDDFVFLTEYQPGFKHTGALTAVDGSYGTPLLFVEHEGSIMSVAAGNFGEFGELGIIENANGVAMGTWVRNEPTRYRSMAIQKNNTLAFKTRGIVVDMAVGDFSKDGVDDIVYGDTQGYVIALDGRTGDLIWKYRTTLPITHLVTHDFFMQDGYTDVIVVLLNGRIYAINGETGLPIWKDHLGPVIVNDMKFADLNNDGTTEELVISMGYWFNPFKGRILVYNTTLHPVTLKGTIIWESINPVGPFTKIQFADFLGTGLMDIAVSIHEKAIWFYKAVDSGVVAPFNRFWTKVQDFAVGDFTANPLPEIAVIVRNGTVITYHSTDWSNTAADYINATRSFHENVTFRFSHLITADLTGDGYDDLVIRSFGDRHYALTMTSNGTIMVWWEFQDHSIFYLEEYRISDMNNDGTLDVLALNHDNIYALDGTSGEVQWVSYIPTYLIRSMAMGDFNNDGIIDVAVGTADGWVHFLHGNENEVVVLRANNPYSSYEELIIPFSEHQRSVFLWISFYDVIFPLIGLLVSIEGLKAQFHVREKQGVW